MKIGILQTGHSPDEVRDTLGNYSQMFAQLLEGQGYEYETFNVVDGIFPEGPDVVDAWLITGSKHGVYEDHDWIPPLEQLIREIRNSGRPLIGVCFGHQIIAQALGGKVEKFKGGWAIGRQNYQVNNETISLNAWHQDQVVSLPEGARVIASNDFCENAGLMIGDSIMTIQPHPEFTAPMIQALIDFRGRGHVPDDLIAKAEQDLNQNVDTQKFASKMIEFLNKGDQ
jgi:GMP synthase (glutamine-hydrolysing)